MEKITLALIAHNEEKDLPRCLDSVKGLVSGIALVDSMSSDRTGEIAAAAGARVLRREFDGYASQKNAALDLASNDWILQLDPDETLSPELKDEIAALFAAGPRADAYSLPYVNYFLGRRMRHGGLGGERHIRLFRKSRCRFEGGLVHEGVRVDGTVGALKHPVIHNSYPDMEEYLDKFNRYTTLAARKMHGQGKRFSIFRICFVPLEFHKRFFLRLGFLDGFAGLAWSAVSAFYVFVKYVKLWRIEQGE
ncbi:MAG: glycosyltransferase family 2 protein [Elusimicrobiales bacterium]